MPPQRSAPPGRARGQPRHEREQDGRHQVGQHEGIADGVQALQGKLPQITGRRRASTPLRTRLRRSSSQAADSASHGDDAGGAEARQAETEDSGSGADIETLSPSGFNSPMPWSIKRVDSCRPLPKAWPCTKIIGQSRLDRRALEAAGSAGRKDQKTAQAQRRKTALRGRGQACSPLRGRLTRVGAQKGQALQGDARGARSASL